MEELKQNEQIQTPKTKKTDEFHLKQITIIALAIFITFCCCILFFFVIYRYNGFTDFWKKLTYILQPVIIGLVVAYLLNPLMKLIDGKLFSLFKGKMKSEKKAKKISRGLAIAGALLFLVGIIVLLINSSYGRAFKSIRDDEVAAEAMGINLFKHKMLSFIISSFFAGVGGALLAMFQTTVQADPFASTMTYELLLIVVIGGIGSITGSCLASFLYIACSEWWLRFLDSGSFMGMSVPFFRDGFRKVVFSVVIMIIVLFFSRGIMGDKELSFSGMIRKARKRKASKEANLPEKTEGKGDDTDA